MRWTSGRADAATSLHLVARCAVQRRGGPRQIRDLGLGELLPRGPGSAAHHSVLRCARDDNAYGLRRAWALRQTGEIWSPPMTPPTDSEGKGAATLNELIYSVLREHIAGGIFPPGWCSERRVSRGPSRRVGCRRPRRCDGSGARGCSRISTGAATRPRASARSRPSALELAEAGLKVPPSVATGLKVRNRRERIYPAVEHVVAACCLWPLPGQRKRACRALWRQPRGGARGAGRLERTGSSRRTPISAGMPVRSPRTDPRSFRDALPARAGGAGASPSRAFRRRSFAGNTSASRGAVRPAHARESSGSRRTSMSRSSSDAATCSFARRSGAAELVLVAVHHAFDLYRDAATIDLMIEAHLAILGDLIAGRSRAATKALEEHLRRSLAQNIDLLAPILAPCPKRADRLF